MFARRRLGAGERHVFRDSSMNDNNMGRPYGQDDAFAGSAPIMVFKREWDSSCPRVWDQWERDGTTYTIQDLRPEDYEEAVRLLVDHFCTDEPLCTISDIINDPVSLEKFKDGWRSSLDYRMTFGGYAKVGGKMTLVAVNVCFVVDKGDKPKTVKEGQASQNIFAALEYITQKKNAFELLGLDRLLHSLGLVVCREYRGTKIGGRLLAVRDRVCKSMDIKGTVAVFTSPASQKVAENCGFTTIAEATWSEMADAGLNIPREDRLIKYMYKMYD